MLWIAIRMLTGDAQKFYGLLFGIGFSTLLITQQMTIFVNLVERGGKWQFQTAPDLGHFLRTSRETVKKLSRAGVETLAVIAYHEPVSRAEIESIRGVQTAKGTLDVLMRSCALLVKSVGPWMSELSVAPLTSVVV